MQISRMRQDNITIRSARIFKQMFSAALYLWLILISIIGYGADSSQGDLEEDWKQSLKVRLVGEKNHIEDYQVSSDKPFLFELNSKKYKGIYIVRERQFRSMATGIEGVRGNITLELWSLDKKGVSEKKWSLTRESDFWGFDGRYLYFLDLGCCGAKNKKTLIDIDSLEEISVEEVSHPSVEEYNESISYPFKPARLDE